MTECPCSVCAELKTNRESLLLPPVSINATVTDLRIQIWQLHLELLRQQRKTEEACSHSRRLHDLAKGAISCLRTGHFSTALTTLEVIEEDFNIHITRLASGEY